MLRADRCDRTHIEDSACRDRRREDMNRAGGAGQNRSDGKSVSQLLHQVERNVCRIEVRHNQQVCLLLKHTVGKYALPDLRADRNIGLHFTFDLQFGCLVDDQMANRCTVLADGRELTYNGFNGWELDDADTIALRRTTCDDLIDGDITDIDVTCPCEAVGN